LKKIRQNDSTAERRRKEQRREGFEGKKKQRNEEMKG
jgi:hypothetical protein